ncbi:hypothetical protein TIFTF001_008016 [Ficus carica]|uniref:Uncharacterized protein n=1 Tax=Ficus carica TaxID=3494 RepID=A0AA88D076_FICCA|nr:hypothetical protein TIFTF001_008016 [Ficus carica]
MSNKFWLACLLGVKAIITSDPWRPHEIPKYNPIVRHSSKDCDVLKSTTERVIKKNGIEADSSYPNAASNAVS